MAPAANFEKQRKNSQTMKNVFFLFLLIIGEVKKKLEIDRGTIESQIKNVFSNYHNGLGSRQEWK